MDATGATAFAGVAVASCASDGRDYPMLRFRLNRSSFDQWANAELRVRSRKIRTP
jgi:hypothetical protein